MMAKLRMGQLVRIVGDQNAARDRVVWQTKSVFCLRFNMTRRHLFHERHDDTPPSH
jgi:hypothetical protein